MLKITKKHKNSTIALDFDGVLHSYTSGWTGDKPTDPPVDGALEFVQKLKDLGYALVIFSARKNSNQEIEKWLEEHNFPKITVATSKPHADLYIDDRGLRFEGNFEKTIEFIMNGDNIKPWYKKDNK